MLLSDLAPPQSQISEQLRAAREAAGLTQQEAAELLGVDSQSVSRWERGERRIRAETFQRALKVYSDRQAGLGPVRPGIVSESAPPQYGEVGFETLTGRQRARAWLEGFLLDIAEKGADDAFMAFARRTLLNPSNYIHHDGSAAGQPLEMRDEQKLRHMKGLSEGVRAILRERQKKAAG